MKNRLKKLFENYIIPAFLALILFAAKFYPLLDISRYNHSNADDFWMSSGGHFVWENTHSVIETIKYTFLTTYMLWTNWDGCFVSMLIGSLPPVVFDEELCKYTFTIIAGILLIGTIWLLFEILVRLLKFSKVHYIMILAGVLMLYTNFNPSIKDAFYWWVGGINYTFMTGVFFISQACLIEYIVSKRRAFLVIGSVFAFLTGLGNLLTSLVNPIVLVLELAVLIWAYKKDRIFFIIPTVCGIAGLLGNVLAPGNLIRGGEELFSNPVLSSIFGAITASTQLMVSYYKKPMAFIFIFMLTVVFDAMRRKKSGFRFRYPVVFVIVSYGVYCAVMAPVVYAQSAYYGRIQNVSFFVLVLVLLLDAIYILGWVFDRKEIKIPDTAAVLIVYIAFALFAGTCFIDKNYFYAAYATESLSLGQAQDFDRRVNERFAMYYNDDIKEVKVEPITWVPNIFYWDEDSLSDIAFYFHKDSIEIVEE